jgi:methionyl-tRNA formyltransferase|tara:strand:- start:831 stop:1475 length:645 start_codon:yes stop_codon:yes gene_type:complete
MKICCVGYRPWALSIYKYVEHLGYDTLMINSKQEYCKKTIKNYNPDYILFYGWSWIIDEDLIENFDCIMLHPSPLPKYRGGSPIQNQIINGEKHSAVTLFLMDSGIDTGDILGQEYLSLEGNLDDIFQRITKTGKSLTKKILEGNFSRTKQNDDESTYFKRRKPSQSEITIEEIKTKSGEYLHNKIRMLQSPYPNSFIRTSDGKKLKIILSELE